MVERDQHFFGRTSEASLVTCHHFPHPCQPDCVPSESTQTLEFDAYSITFGQSVSLASH
jgi:hypothetical protein